MMSEENKKVRALYLFEGVIAAYFIGIIAIQTWLVYGG